HQVFIVCPLVGDGEEIPDERKAVTAYAEKLQREVFPDLRIAVLHGKMKAKDKETVMAAFAAGESDILVSTTVIEVGVDVPNANTMIVENADRFGLSQLHQLRGRVGRGSAKSYCILLSDTQNEETKQRLKVMTATNDGFKISEEDLRLRGPGDFFGQRQHGLPAMKIADLSCDMRLLDEAQTAAKALLAEDGALEKAENRALRRRIGELFELNAEALN
ncbi:MAG: ATP-dependent DNA helicase RecG, partial [Oscillospiraceae bacterium]|nr:ATP-dependent DNA helicase RecG [Oscillospiraceae bacterium]